ncbi:ABC transporter permease [Mangrovibacterium diazotrophicum]|uniref:Putative ABC transport system permease protein n=1 Tax=Mangrovibacterium diazotrophicum TaxID=1261403 RepID=A0A419W9H9_9BACT|nr:ABC transporter permease [Mangrovibacterium diazotrophicum]RKD92074.1 putative ABC transport system permease protein [Mangrovibacterium diazotrophicum]
MRTRIQYALRNINRNRLNVTITTIGLSMALASTLIIFLFVGQEHSYNRFHENADRIFRLNYEITSKDGTRGSNILVKPELAKALEDRVPQIEHCTPFRMGYMAQLDLEEKNLGVKLGIANQEFFDMFSFNLLKGNRNDLLVDPTDIVITKSLAQKIAGNDSPNYDELIGQSLDFTFIKDVSFTITGILDDVPRNSTLDFEAMIPFDYEGSFWESNNGFGNSILFYELKKGVDPEQANKLIYAEVKDFYQEDIEKSQKDNFLQNSSDCFRAFALPLKSLYLDNTVDGASYQLTGSRSQLRILTIVALLILFIAFSNYIILTIGQFFKKAGEVSVRKSMGGKNIDIFKMFLTENSITILISYLVGGILGYVLIPVFNHISESQIYFNLVNIPSLVLFAILSIVLLVVLTSLIPVFIFRRVKPTLLSTKRLFAGKKAGASQVFVGLQYALTIVLIIATISINKQTNYLKNKSLGFSEKNILSVDVRYLNQSTAAVLRDMLQKETGVLNASLTNRDFFDGYSTRTFKVSGSEVLTTYVFKADHYFIPTLNLSLLAGRNFTESNVVESDKTIIVNEEFARRMKFDTSPVGRIVDDGNSKYTIIGLVNDYQFLTSREKIEPMILYARTNMGNGYSSVLVKYNPQNLDKVIAAIKAGWKKIDTKESLNYTFWDKELESRYKSEERLSKTILYASVIAIVILSLGLFGLTVLISAQRTGEIGIRKVNGARIAEVIIMLNSNYLKWVLYAFILACPIAWYLMHKWLEGFAYKTELSWWIFALAGLLALGIALLTVSWQSWRAATRNPVEALRYE